MVQIGKINTLRIKTKQAYGVHLDGGAAGDILLLTKEVPDACQPGDTVEVFVYRDREEHLRATTQKPYATVGQFALLQVITNSPSGAYLDWGMGIDLFVPKSEQQDTMREGKSYVVFVFLSEKNNSIIASSKLDKFLGLQPLNYKEGNAVDLIIFDKTDLGYKAVVNSAHAGMLYENEVFQKLLPGQQLKGYIKKIREDLKIDLSLQQPGYQGVDAVSQNILETIKEHGGSIPITDKSLPEEIYSRFGVSKKVFKKAIGSLYKKRLITIDSSGITRTSR
ncbi:MAG: GntR family transcriptional regulator [Proteobacteria bacterium]|nr:GntR family transcriptional regulator [Pseudomonadota bacterium]MBU1059426.1 GntR family transcriptional regulator [Pseudomonadota bacterium]